MERPCRMEVALEGIVSSLPIAEDWVVMSASVLFAGTLIAAAV